MSEPNGYALGIEIVKTIGIIVVAVVGVWTLKVSMATHRLSNSRMTEMLAKVDTLTLALGISQGKEQAAQAKLDAGP